jgi:hypothetical protein
MAWIATRRAMALSRALGNTLGIPRRARFAPSPQRVAIQAVAIPRIGFLGVQFRGVVGLV